jgi:hypothetical protein
MPSQPGLLGLVMFLQSFGSPVTSGAPWRFSLWMSKYDAIPKEKKMGMRVVRWGLGALGVAVAAGVLAFGFLGFGTASADPGPGRTNEQTTLAAKLNISLTQLQAAEKAARDQLIDDAVTAGKLTADQAAKLKSGQRPAITPGQVPSKPQGQGNGRKGLMDGLRSFMQNYDTVLAQKLGISVQTLQAAQKATRDELKAQRPANQGKGPGQGGKGIGGQGMIFQGVRDAISAAASTLGMTPADLQAQIKAGKSLGEIAQSKGIDKAALRSGIMGAIQTDVNNALRDGKITSTQATSIIDRASKGLDQLIDGKMGQGGPKRGPNQGAPKPGGTNPGGPNRPS